MLLRVLAAGLLFVAGGAAVALTVPDGQAMGLPESAWIGVFMAALLGLLLTAAASRAPERPPSKTRAPRPQRQRPQRASLSDPTTGRNVEPRTLEVRAPEPDRSTVSGARAGRAAVLPPIDPSLVLVIPFEVSGPDPTVEFMADGMAEEVLLGLSSLGGTRVVPRTSAFTFKGTDDPEGAARRLGAAHVLSGELSRSAGLLTLRARLFSTERNDEVWSRDWAFRTGQTCETQADLINAVAVSLQVPVEAGRPVLSLGRQTDDAEAQEHYLQGRFFYHQRGEALQRSAVSFEQAVRGDIGFALAHAGRADAHMLLGFYGYMEPRTAFQKAKESAEKALELDDQIAEAWTSLGFVRSFYEWDWGRSEVCFRRAEALNASYMPARYWSAMSRGVAGHLEDWVQHNESSLKVDPLASHARAHLAWALLICRDWDGAEAAIDESLKLDPEFTLGHWFRGRARWHRGEIEDAMLDLREGARRSRGNPITLGTLGYSLAQTGETGHAQRLLEELEAGPARWRWVRPSQIATVQLGLGQTEEALASLERGLVERDFWLPLTIRRPEWDVLREESRFQEILAGMGLSELHHRDPEVSSPRAS